MYDASGFTQAKYDLMLSVANHKPIAIGEAALLPTPSQLAAQPRWTYFLGWAEFVQPNNTNEQIQAVYNDARVLTLDEMPGWNNPTAPGF